MRSETLESTLAEKYDGWDILTLEQDRWPRVLARIPVGRWLLSGVPR